MTEIEGKPQFKIQGKRQIHRLLLDPLWSQLGNRKRGPLWDQLWHRLTDRLHDQLQTQLEMDFL